MSSVAQNVFSFMFIFTDALTAATNTSGLLNTDTFIYFQQSRPVESIITVLFFYLSEKYGDEERSQTHLFHPLSSAKATFYFNIQEKKPDFLPLSSCADRFFATV